MSKRFYNLSIEDIENRGCSPELQEHLLAMFYSAVKPLATTLARKAWYDLRDFYSAKDRGVEDFQLTIERQLVCGQEQWWGEFVNGDMRLHVVGVLEK